MSSTEETPAAGGMLRRREIQDGSWLQAQLPPERRIDWENAHRDKTIALFGADFYRELLMGRIRRACKNYPTG